MEMATLNRCLRWRDSLAVLCVLCGGINLITEDTAKTRTTPLAPTRHPAQPILRDADKRQSTLLVPARALLPTPPESQTHSPNSAHARDCWRSQMSASPYPKPL